MMGKIVEYISSHKKAIISGVILAIIIASVPVGLYLVEHPAIFGPKAAEMKQSIVTPSADFSYRQALPSTKPTYKLTISGDVNLSSDKSYIRVVLVDKNNKEYLVYETYPLTTGSNSFSIDNACAESCVLDGITPSYVRIEGNSSSLKIKKITTLDKPEGYGFKAGKRNIQEVDKLTASRNQATIQKLNENIKKKGLKWIAGETSVSKLTYEQKKRLFSNPDKKPLDHLPNLQGFEYYKGGVFEIAREDRPTPNLALTSTPIKGIPDNFDYRNWQGENWITSVKNQGGYATCWAYANMGTLEGVINVYYNRHLDLDLSEQYLISCNSNSGSVDEDCFPYQGNPVLCSNKCSDWSSRFWNSSQWHSVTPTSFDDLKAMIIQKGPIYLHYPSLSHALVIVGFGKDLYPSITQDYVIVKDSFGTEWGDRGFGKLGIDPNFISGNGFYTHEIPVIPNTQTLPTLSIQCVDKDNDGYCNWGISATKPSTCPSSCKAEKDCDDSNPNLNLDCSLPSSTATPTPPPIRFSCTSCLADINQDGIVDSKDKSIVINCFNKMPDEKDDSGNFCYPADLNGDILISGIDTSCIGGKFGQPCPVAISLTCTTCKADINKDGKIDNTDLQKVTWCYGKSPWYQDGSGNPCIEADVIGDKWINGSDLNCVLNHLNEVCQPTPTPFICTACAADVTKDTYVNGADVSYLVPCMNKLASATGTNGKPCSDKDVNRDGTVNQKDVDCIKEQFLKECAASPAAALKRSSQ